jgi:hypothetical protein
MFMREERGEVRPEGGARSGEGDLRCRVECPTERIEPLRLFLGETRQH